VRQVLQQVVPQSIAGLQKANVSCEINLLIFMTILDLIPLQKKKNCGCNMWD
jgi:hypothetical protein